jgi:flagellar basal body rod protein FlgG
MIEMIASMRAYESNQRVIRAIDETLSRGIQIAQPI